MSSFPNIVTYTQKSDKTIVALSPARCDAAAFKRTTPVARVSVVVVVVVGSSRSLPAKQHLDKMIFSPEK
jgi:hypothetical protein